MNITIAGYGPVGQAHNALLQEAHEIDIVDPAYAAWNFPIAPDTEAVIVCVPTPSNAGGGCEMKHVYEVIEASPNVPILIKSTISVEGWQMLVDTFPEKTIAFSPEFLRADSAEQDLRSQELILMGGKGCNFWAKIFDVKVEVCDPEALILAKYARNSFLALKVAYFNQMYDLCKALNVDYGAVAHYTVIDPRIGDSHSVVTEERGFGGHCFPKDVEALIRTAQRDNVELSILQEALEYNRSIRKS